MSEPAQSDQVRERLPWQGCLVLGLVLAGTALAALVVLAIVSANFLRKGQQPSRTRADNHPAAGRRLPDLELQPLAPDAGPITLSDLEGKVVLVNLWGTWCPPCRIELPHIEELAKRFADRPDFELLAVSCGAEVPEDAEQLREQTKSFLARLRLDLPAVTDLNFTTRNALNSVAGLEALPATFLLDRQGVIRAVWFGFGPGDPEQIEAVTRRLLDEG